MIPQVVVTQYHVQSYAITVALEPGDGYPDPVTGVTIALVSWVDQGATAIVHVTSPGRDTITRPVSTGDTLQIGLLGGLGFQVQFTTFTPSGIEATIMSI